MIWRADRGGWPRRSRSTAGWTGVDLCQDGPLWLASDGAETGEIGESVRIGITKDAHRLLRFYLRGSVFVSGPKTLNL
ncbi:DNA-3-methyladenine glycosylase [Acidisoma silvae]|uniref:DNA-3-methyladenine glycosylase n=1 Tax=Acidisoma silvae TaxID=2802396 RepID=A0A964DXL4_9PROT|nr:DNA-3-methyladenine glycosylase [Acidisoma silvae]